MTYLLPLAVFILLSTTVAYFTRASWQPTLDNFAMRFPSVKIAIPFTGAARSYIYNRLPQSFVGDVEAGLSSSTFDLAANVDSGDSRAGLDDAAKAEILRIMKKRRLKFDDARRAYMENCFSAHGIGPDGRPRDPKFVSFS